MMITRKEFLKAAGGAVAITALSSAAPAAAMEKPGPKRGVSTYSFSDDIFKNVTLEDCLYAIGDLSSEEQPEIGLEIIANSHITGYPNPTDAWVTKWFDMLKKYHLKPVEYCHWVDSRLWTDDAPWLSSKESYEMLVRDIKIANKLGFTCGRTKLGVIDGGGLVPVPNWREFIKMALPVAEKYNFRMLPEIHNPTNLKDKMIDDYVEFIEKEKTTPWFGLNIDFGVFQARPTKARSSAPAVRASAPTGGGPRTFSPSAVADMIPLLPYVHCCHAKFMEMDDDCNETTIPYPEIIKMLLEHKWNGYIMSEYEGPDRNKPGAAFTAVRKQQVMLRRLLENA